MQIDVAFVGNIEHGDMFESVFERLDEMFPGIESASVFESDSGYEVTLKYGGFTTTMSVEHLYLHAALADIIRNQIEEDFAEARRVLRIPVWEAVTPEHMNKVREMEGGRECLRDR